MGIPVKNPFLGRQQHQNMKWFIAIVLLAASAYSVSGIEYHLTEEEFEEKFHEHFHDEDEREKAREELRKAQEHINKVNKDFEEGKGTYTEKLYLESNMPMEEFEAEFEGAEMDDSFPEPSQMQRSFGAFLPPAYIRNDPVNAAKVDAYYKSLTMNRDTVPESYDLREHNLVTPPKDQYYCGSCGAFATAGMIESCMLKVGAPFENMDLSEQYLIDGGYDGKYMKACRGAHITAYGNWFCKNGEGNSKGQGAHERTCGYKGWNDDKRWEEKKGQIWNSGARLNFPWADWHMTEDKFKRYLVTHGALLIVMNARKIKNYDGGVFDGCSASDTSINHAVLLVGYGTE